MSESRKRSRKSKLEIRETDFEYEVVSEQNDETTPLLQKVPRTVLQLEYPEIPVSYDHDYCQRGSQSFAQLVHCNPIRSKNKPNSNEDLELEKIRDSRGRLSKEKRPGLLRKMASTSKRGKILKTKSIRDSNSIKLCKYEPESLLSESRETAASSPYPADKILDILMRNMWGQVLYTPRVVDSHETLLQLTLDLWQVWYNSCKFVRGCPLFYQCHICNLAWWRLQPFRDHIKIHDMNKLKVSLKENVHECMIIASEESVRKVKFIDIAEDCWKCGQGLEFHKKYYSAYTCIRCNKNHYTCVAWHNHTTKCFYGHGNHNVSKERQCTVCNHYVDSVDLIHKHMVLSHTVRSDVVVPVSVKQCSSCDSRYFTYNMHNCFRRSKNNACDYCCRKFATKYLATAHMLSPCNVNTTCRICGESLPMNCQEMEHILKSHPNNYCLAFKCTLCSDQCKLFPTEESISMHRNNWHQKKTDKRRSFYELILVSKNSLGMDIVEEPFRFDKAIEPSIKTAGDIHDESETKSIQVLSADIDVIVDEVDIKKEPIYDENGEIDYEEMLRSMFSDSTENKRNYIKYEDLKKETIDNDVKEDVKNQIAFNGDKPIVKIQIAFNENNEPIVKNQIAINEDKPIVKNQIAINEGKPIVKNQMAINEDKPIAKNQIAFNEDKPIAKIQIAFNENNEPIIKNQIAFNENIERNIEANENFNNVKIKTEPIDDIDIIEHPLQIVQVKSEPIDDSSQDEIENTEQSELNENIDTLIVKVEPDIDLNDITSGNIRIKCESVVKSEDESDTLNQLLNLGNDMDWVTEEINPDEITVDILCPSGIYKKKKLYACAKCGYTAEHKHYTLHKTSGCSVSPGINESYLCSKCGLTFVMFRNYVLHFDSHGYDVMSCPKCGEAFDQLVKLLSHVHRHIKNSFVLIHVLNKGGEESHKSNKEFKCQECREVVPNADMFRHWEAHLTLKTSDNLEMDTTNSQVKEESPELTVDCERVTMNTKKLESATLKVALEQLKSTTSVDKQCAVCYRAFSRRCDVKRHIVEHLLMDAHVLKAHHNGFRCQICGEGFTKQDNYKFHMREHGSMPIFKCELCDKTFSDSSNFAKHKKTHGVRVMECDLCRKKFHSRLALQKHILEHSKEAKYECVQCPATFTTKPAYKRHRYQHVTHKFKCVICDIGFTALQQKWDHDWEVHKERKLQADCPICFKSFRKMQDVRNHARSEHRARLRLPMRPLKKAK